MAEPNPTPVDIELVGSTPTKKPSLLVVKGGHTIEVEVGTVAPDAPMVEQPADASTPSTTTTAPEKTASRVTRRTMLIGAGVFLVAVAAALAGWFVVSSGTGSLGAQSLASIEDVASDAASASTANDVKALSNDLEAAQKDLDGLMTKIKAEESGDDARALKALVGAEQEWVSTTLALAQASRADVNDKLIDPVVNAADDLSTAIESAIDAGVVDKGNATLDPNSEGLLDTQSEAHAEFITARDKRSVERTTAQKKKTAQITKIRQYNQQFTAKIASYESLREETGAWSSEIQNVPWAYIMGGDFNRLQTLIDRRVAIRSEMSSMATNAPPSLAQPSQNVISILDQAIAGMRKAHDGMVDTVSLSTPYAYITETPAWSDFLAASDIISNNLPGAKSKFDSAAKTALQKAQKTKIPPPITA